MRKIRLTFGRKLALLYILIFAGSYYVTHTIGLTIVRNKVLAEIMSTPELDATIAPARIRYYFNVLDTALFLMAAALAIAFLLIYAMNTIPLKKLCHAAKNFSINRVNSPVSLHTQDEYQDLAEALNIIANDLNNFDEYQRAFISNISHDFRSPLTSIRGYAQAMLDGTIPPEAQEKYLNIILSETDRLTNLTSNLLELNSFNRESVLLDLTNFNIHETIIQTVNTLEGTAAKKGITFFLDFHSKKELVVNADEAKIHQVLYNLIDNAVKFSHNNSEIKIGTTKKGDKIFVSVKDSGIGIPKDSLNKVFDRFYKTDLSRGKDKKGTGLGLSISKEIINSHKQTINVVSTEGVGTEFVFTLKKG
ncbi:MAG: HAMP domain-containing histidine kinase [Roseburia sp.]|nr:HAMP domain-containing histidine kinase [Roseburia sp.]